MTFAKMYLQMLDGTLRTHACWEAMVTFQQFLILGYPNGIVDMNAEAISIRTGIPVDIIKAGIVALEAPDPGSRTPTCEGRRITRLDDHRDWGWRITNFVLYRDMQNEEARQLYKNKWARDKYAETNQGAPAAVGTNRDQSGQPSPVGTDHDKSGHSKSESERKKGQEHSLSGKPDRAAFPGQTKEVFAYWQKMFNHPKSILDDKRAKLITERLKEGHSVPQLKTAITGCSRSKWHMGANDRNKKYYGIHIIFSSAAKVDEFCQIVTDPPPPMAYL
jgi:hypothetical protein